jgi:O-antigen/teichoic acid export membrane protein
MNHGTLSSRARSGAAWTVLGFGAGQAIRLAANIVLAALLFEEAFALMAIVTAVMQGLAMFSDIGLQPSVVRSQRGDEPEFLNTAWTIQFIRGLLLFIGALALTWPMASFYSANDASAEQLLWLIPIVAFSAILDGLQSSRMLTAARQLQLARITQLELGVQLFNAVVMVGLAWYFRSVYALAVASVMTAALRTALTHIVLPGLRNRWRLERQAVREIVHFGKWIFLSTLLSFLALQIDRLAFARLFPLAEVGVYSIAASLALLVGVLVGSLQSSVVFPWYSRMLDSGVELQEAFRRTRVPVLVLATYVTTLLIVGARPFFELAYDPRYAAGAIFLPILALGVWFSCIESMYGAAFLASGRSHWIALVSAVKVMAFVLLLIPFVLEAGNLVWAAVMVTVTEILRAVASQWLGWRMKLRNLRAEVAMLVLLLSVSGTGLWLVYQWSVFQSWHPLIQLVFLGSIVSALYVPLFIRTLVPLLRNRTT